MYNTLCRFTSNGRVSCPQQQKLANALDAQDQAKADAAAKLLRDRLQTPKNALTTVGMVDIFMICDNKDVYDSGNIVVYKYFITTGIIMIIIICYYCMRVSSP